MLEAIINLPVTPRIEREEDVGNDNRYKLVLLHRETRNYRVLGIPYGADLTSKVEVPSAIYFEASPDEVKYGTIVDPTLSLIKHRGYTYPLIKVEDKKAVVPYKTKGEFPVAYTDNQLYSLMEEHTDKIIKRIEEVVRTTLKPMRSGEFNPKKIRGAFEELGEACRMDRFFPVKAYDLIEEAFSDEAVSSSRMTRTERKSKHWHLGTLNLKVLPGFEEKDNKTLTFIKLGAKNYIKSALQHPVSSTFMKRNCISLKELRKEVSRKRVQEMMAAVKELYPELFEEIKKMNSDSDDSSSKAFRNLTFLAGGVAALLVNLPTGLGILSYGLLDRYFSKKHAESHGTYTGIMGQIRDSFTKEELRDFYFFDVPERGHLI